MVAALYDWDSIVEALLAAGAAVNYATPEGEDTALILAVAADKDSVDDAACLAVSKRLLAAGADVLASDSAGLSALIIAGIRDRLSLVDTLIEAGADVHAPAAAGFTAILLACDSGRTSFVPRLLAAGADVNATVAGHGPPLALATLKGWGATVEALVQHGADVNHASGFPLSGSLY